MHTDLWLPVGHPIAAGATVRRLLFGGDTWQVIETSLSHVLLANPDLADRWLQVDLLAATQIQEIRFGSNAYRVIDGGSGYILGPAHRVGLPLEMAEALAFAIAFRETRRLHPDVSLHDAIYVERFSRLLPTWSLTLGEPDDVVLGAWLTGGVRVSARSYRRMEALTGWAKADLLRGVLERVGLPADPNPVPADAADPSLPAAGNQAGRRFVLVGRPALENFFNEHVVEIVDHPDRYQAFGIGFPPAFVLHGPPGCGKTYAVERLTEFLDWPSFSIDSGSIGSPYIHETSRKIAATFDQAAAAAPAIVVIDEMDSFLSARQLAGLSGLHHVEEVNEFLHRISAARDRRVLVVGMTNAIDSIDSAALRRGRFDHVIAVAMPSADEVKVLIQSLLAQIPVSDSLDITPAVERLAGRAMSDVTFVIREAARLAARKRNLCVDQESLLTALAGLPATPAPSQRRIGFV